MKLKFYPAVTLLFLVTVLVSCDRSKCTNTNTVFETHVPSSEIYKAELAKQLLSLDPSEMRYWLQKYELIEGEEFLFFYIQGDGLCAKIMLTMSHWGKLQKLREKKGVTYRNAEFTNLKFDIAQDSATTRFIYLTYDRIID